MKMLPAPWRSRARFVNSPTELPGLGSARASPFGVPEGLEAQVVTLEPGSCDGCNLSAVLFPLPLAG